MIEQLQDHGVSLSIDDFGAGFTSFGYLREFAVREIKIDRSYIARFTESRFDQSLVTSLVVLCDCLGIPLVAEGWRTRRRRRCWWRWAAPAARATASAARCLTRTCAAGSTAGMLRTGTSGCGREILSHLHHLHPTTVIPAKAGPIS
ncbi:EAL domain-containing protein [Novosphingobium resinovorum]